MLYNVINIYQYLYIYFLLIIQLYHIDYGLILKQKIM